MFILATSQAVRECEERNFAAGMADPLELMQSAGNGCAEEFLKFFNALCRCKRVVIFAGCGNNGGDGVVMAEFLHKVLPVPVILSMVDKTRLSNSSKYFFDRLSPEVQVIDAADVKLVPGDALIDALLGTGCSGQLKEPYKSLIGKINCSGAPVFAVDLPSGLGSDLAVKADFTATIGFFKDILFTADGVENSGLLRLVPLNLPLPVNMPPDTPSCTGCQWFRLNTPALPRNIHKYQRGSVLIAGGSENYQQAPFLSARAALRAGAGLVRLVLPFATVPGCGTLGVIPTEVTACNRNFCADSFLDIENFLNKTNVIAAGPGMGRSDSAGEFVSKLLEVNKPLILDADAIYLAAQSAEKLKQRVAPTLLTPHRGEAANLAKKLNVELSGCDLTDAQMLAAASNSTVLLKAARTVIASPDGKIFINTSGTPALATAGSGDVLTGIAAAAMCRFDPLHAAARSSFLHGMAGEMAALKFGENGVIADDLADFTAQAQVAINRSGDIFE